MDTTPNYAFMAIGISGIAFNALEMVMIFKGGEYRLPFQMSVLSLAVADLLASLSVATCNALMLILKLVPPFPAVLVQAFQFSFTFSSISSQLHVILITIQRLIAVLAPFSCKRIMTSFRCSVMLALIWVISLIVTMLINYMPESDAISILTVATGVVIALSYAFIVYRIRNRRAGSSGDSNRSSDVTLYSGILLLLFVTCFFPFVCISLIFGKEKGYNGPWMIIYYLFWLNIVTNPMVYFLFKVFKSGAVKCFKTHQTSDTNVVPR
eukprot:gene8361-14331_t